MIEIKNLTKKIGNTQILNDISFSVKTGEILGFLGPNGAGKTSTMKIITSFWRPTSGSIMIDGLDTEKDSLATRAKIGYLPETVPLYEDMKVKEYLKFVAAMRGLSGEKLKARLEEVAAACGIASVLGKLIDELSKGYRQRVGLAQAIMGNPDVLILDEPTTGLDPNQIMEIRELIKKIGREKTVIFSTHILGEVSAVCDRVIIINNGKIVGEGSPNELINQTKAKEIVKVKVEGAMEKVLALLKKTAGVIKAVSVGVDGEAVLYEVETEAGRDVRAAINKALIIGGFNVLEIAKHQASLEDAFRELTK
ncbi:MAG TPA: ATP-binding cassette domain-containing protein [Candidatus Methylomirabilis sp.]|nr:ATP-binding cassette domain-containing protein [Candidatus Methylomirabilis sp.]